MPDNSKEHDGSKSRGQNGRLEETPTLPTRADVRRNLAEWEVELRRRVAILVRNVVDQNQLPNEPTLRRLGLDGRRYYQTSLQLAFRRNIDAQANREVVAENAGDRMRGRALVQLSSKPNWHDRRSERPKYTKRARKSSRPLVAAIIVATILTLNSDLLAKVFTSLLERMTSYGLL
ncbi:hypothetical protein U0C82_18325 [Fulvimarina sp. 2208YS6-2-32]|uniref:Uncharacterized protein n=1 Tax=Fulvimarina uroteuthidis TaxID=3098149 RepID=A0ABU5I8E2_9HYPH|nr:hypothetical protein [Fulvimarina sp. 2208YS6-2-32]MDY8111083.1 hypothetical protein [Fulvimarina sp. 2208YS6-2-32]